jgi:hypothetical protein
MLAASRQGIDVSISGLKELSTKYLSLNEGVDRAQFLMKTFGRSGSEMGKLMEVGADGIDAATKAIADNLIVTAQSKINIENYKRSVDNLNDSWTGVKLTIGNEVIPQLDLLMRVMTKGKDEVEKHEQAVNLLEEKISRLAVAAAWGNESANYAMEDLQFELESLNSIVPGTTGTIDELTTGVESVTSYFKALTLEMIYNKVAASLDADAQLVFARYLGLIDDNTLNTLTSIEALTTKYDLNKDGVIDVTEKTTAYITEILRLKGAVDLLQDKTIHINVVTNGSLNNQDILPLTSNGGNAPYTAPIKNTPTSTPVINVNPNANGGGMSDSDMSKFAGILSVAVSSAVAKTRD